MLAIPDQTTMVFAEMDSRTIAQIECFKFSNRPATTGAHVRRKSLTLLLVPAVLNLAPGQPLGFGSGVAAAVFADRGSLFEFVAPPIRRQNFRRLRNFRSGCPRRFTFAFSGFRGKNTNNINITLLLLYESAKVLRN